MPDTTYEFERRYAEYLGARGGSARRRARDPENWDFIRFLAGQIDDGMKVPPSVEANLRSWLSVVEHRERRHAEFIRLSSLTIEQRFTELSIDVVEYVGRHGDINEHRRIEGDRHLQGVKLLIELKEDFPQESKQSMLSALRNFQKLLENHLGVAKVNEGSSAMRAIVDKHIARAEKKLELIRRICRSGNVSEMSQARSLRGSTIRSIETLIHAHRRDMTPRQEASARELLKSLSSIRPTNGGQDRWVNVVPGGLPTMGRGHK